MLSDAVLVELLLSSGDKGAAKGPDAGGAATVLTLCVTVSASKHSEYASKHTMLSQYVEKCS